MEVCRALSGFLLRKTSRGGGWEPGSGWHLIRGKNILEISTEEKKNLLRLSSFLISFTTADLSPLNPDLKGPPDNNGNGLSSSSAPSVWLIEMIQMGLADVMVTGGSDSLCEVSFSGFSSLKLVDPESCKPFDKRPAGVGDW